jgi:hypothetical protein
MDIIVRTPVHKRSPRHFLVDGLQVWVTYLDENDNGPYGLRIQWLEHKYSCSPLDHITDDGGYTFQKYDSFLAVQDGGIEMRVTAPETDPEKLDRLGKIFVTYQQLLGETVFSV